MGQCGGQNWSGCTSCPGDQVCKPNGKDPWTKVCVDSTTGSTTTTATTSTLTCGKYDSSDCISEFANAEASGNLSGVCSRCVSEGGSNPLRLRCSKCCTDCPETPTSPTSTTRTSTSTTTTASTTSTTESRGTCTAYSQCGGQHWSGCTLCPGRQVCKFNGKDPWTKVCVDPTAELTESPGGTCTAYSQCGGQNWSGCTSCPGDQMCKPNGKDPWTKVCVDSTTGSTTTTATTSTTTMSTTSTSESRGTCTAYSQCGGQNWSGCTLCPAGQVCKFNGKDLWTKVCVDPLAELSGDPSSTDAAIIV